jgi:uncharacterized protein (DUF1697 family)
MRQIVLLRGINLPARNRISMRQLRELLAQLAGFDDVRTYLQSGNVVLWSEASPAQVGRECERQIAERLGLDISVVVRTRPQLAAVVKRNPLGDVATDPRLYQVSFCAAKPGAALVRRLGACASEAERFKAVGRELYAWYPDGVGRSRLAAHTARLGAEVAATARNWTTVTALLELAGQ